MTTASSGPRRTAVISAVLLAAGTAAGLPWLAPRAVEPGPALSGPFYLGGIHVNEPEHGRWVEALRDVGMNTVSATVYAKQGNWDTDHFWFNDEEPAVVDEIRAAKSAGLNVVLIPRVALDHAHPKNRFFWHGMIMPASEEAIRSWFRQYGTFVKKWAAVAEREGVDVFGVGAEMKSLSATLPIPRFGNARNYWGHYWYQWMYRDRALRYAEAIESERPWLTGHRTHQTLEEYLEDRFTEQVAWADQVYLRDAPDTLAAINRRRELIRGLWVEMIREVRSIYRGKLTYGANFDNYHNVGFWDELDYIGINAYFPLRADLGRELDSTAKLALFRRGWSKVFGAIREFRDEQGLGRKPVLFTELGYIRRESCTVEPWSHAGFSVVGWKGSTQLVIWREQPEDREERTLAVRALAETQREQPDVLGGLLYWKLSTLHEHEKIEPFMLHVGPDSDDPLQEALLAVQSRRPADAKRP